MTDYSYLQNEPLEALQETTKSTLRENDIAFDVLLTLDKSDLNEQLKISFGDTKRILNFIEQNKVSSPDNNNTSNTTSTAVKDTNIGGALLSGVNAQNIDAHTETHITNIIQQQTTPSSPKKLAVESLPRVNKKSFDLNNKKAIGVGATSNIYTHESKGQTIAIKIYHPHVVSNKTVQREIAALSFLRHQNILPVYGLIVDSDNNIVGYMMEKMSRSLQALLDDEKAAISKTSQQQKIIWLIQISSALVYSHDNKIFHADIKPDNILLTESTPAICKVSDFGSAHIIATSTAASASSTSVRGTCGFTAPEWLMGEIKKPTPACDVFSFGVLMWCLFHPGVDNELGQTETQINFAIGSGKRPKMTSSSSSTNIPSEIKKLIIECWDHNADIRPTMSNVLAKLERIVDSGKSSSESDSATSGEEAEKKANQEAEKKAKEEAENATTKPVEPKLLEGELLKRYKNYALGKYNLTVEDRVELAKVTKIGDAFFKEHRNLKNIDLAPLKNVTEIGDFFLYNCRSITTLDLAPLKNVTTVGSYFLYNCSSITTLDLAPLENVRSVADAFLAACSSITTLDLAPLSNVASVGNKFLGHCSSITALDLAPLSNVTSIGDDFLCYFSSITTLDLAPLSNVTSIGGGFLYDCRSITALDLAPLSNISRVGGGFLCMCSSIATLDLTPLSNISRVGDGFLKKCSSITALDLAPLSNVTSIGDDFLCYCSSITTLDLAPLKNVTSVGDSFLYGCSSITTLDLAPLSNVTSIGEYDFLKYCSSNVKAQGKEFKQRKGLN